MAFLIMYNRYRIKRLTIFVNEFHKIGLLKKKEYELLAGNYRGFFRYLEGYPDRDKYAILYLHNDFRVFSEQSILIFKYLFVAIPSLLFLTILGFIFWGEI